MLTRKALTNLLTGVFNELVDMGLRPDRMILFGSYAKGNIHAYSDVDLAIWNKKLRKILTLLLKKLREMVCFGYPR